MRIHSDVITSHDIYQCAYAANPGRTFVLLCEPRGSRKRDHAFEVALEGSSPYVTQYDRCSKAATWDEWGLFLAGLFERDPDAICGGYKGLADFTDQTRAMAEAFARYARLTGRKQKGRTAPWLAA